MSKKIKLAEVTLFKIFSLYCVKSGKFVADSSYIYLQSRLTLIAIYPTNSYNIGSYTFRSLATIKIKPFNNATPN